MGPSSIKVRKLLFAVQCKYQSTVCNPATQNSLGQITMSKLEGVKTVVVGGKTDVPQQYCGTVGGQSTDFSTVDTEIKVI